MDFFNAEAQRRRGRGVNTEVGPVWFLGERLRDGIEFF